MIVKAYMEWALRQQIRGKHETILLVDMTLGEDTNFVPFTQNALGFIKRTDPRRYRTIMREVRYIVNSHLKIGGSYQRKVRRISVNFPIYSIDQSKPDYDLHLAAYACMLVHEATHGRILSFGVPYNDKTWERCEILCRREEKRFASRIRSSVYNAASLVSDVDKNYYLSMRKTTLMAKLRAIIDVIRNFSDR